MTPSAAPADPGPYPGHFRPLNQLRATATIQENAPWFEARRTAYQEHLAEVSATGSWDAWVQFFATGISASAVDVAQRVDRLLKVQLGYVRALQDINARGVIRDIVDELVGDPVITVSMMAQRFSRTSPAVSTAIGRLVQMWILDGPFGTYGRQYIARDVWQAIMAPPGAVPGPDAPLIIDTPVSLPASVLPDGEATGVDRQ